MLFHLFRNLLVFAVLTYVIVKLVDCIWRFQVSYASAPRGQRTLGRYFAVSLLRARWTRFIPDFAQVAVLGLVLAWLISCQL